MSNPNPNPSPSPSPNPNQPPSDVVALLATEAVDGTLTDAAALLSPTPTPAGAAATAGTAGAAGAAGAAGVVGAAADDGAAGEARMGAALAASEWEPEELAEIEALVRAYAAGSTGAAGDSAGDSTGGTVGGAADPTEQEPLVVTAPSSRRRRLMHYTS